MLESVLDILNDYLLEFPLEKERQSYFLNYLKKHNSNEIIDWNNFAGHIVASGFIYAKEEEKFLVLYHKDMKMFLYPGGHVDSSDLNILTAAKREVKEETGLSDFKQLKILDNELIPIDIDTHKINYNERLNLPEHYHFDFRYLFIVDKIQDVKIDLDEMSEYKWISILELEEETSFKNVVSKIKKYYLKYKE